MVEVYHWYVQQHARGNAEVVKAYRDVMFGDTEKTKRLMKSLGEWAIKGLVLQPVAKVNGDSLDNAWNLTNHIDSPWTENQGLTVLGDGRWRSSSVGDVMKTGGKVFVVGKFGFDDVGTAADFALVDAQ